MNNNILDISLMLYKRTLNCVYTDYVNLELYVQGKSKWLSVKSFSKYEERLDCADNVPLYTCLG